LANQKHVPVISATIGQPARPRKSHDQFSVMLWSWKILSGPGACNADTRWVP
jgi:hypothetical protein